MRIVLVGAEFEENLAVRYIRGALEAAGHEVVQLVFNETGDLERVARALAASNAPLAGFSMVFTLRARQFATLARRARALGFAGHLTAGGHFAALNAEALLRDVAAFDSVVRGEGELPMLALADHLEDPSSVPGLVRRAADGRIVAHPLSDKPADLDALPWPVHRRPYDTYFGLSIANMLASRGCTHACAFCSIAAWHRFCGGPRLRLRRPEAVVEEMAALYDDGVRIFNFHDDNFLLPDPAQTAARLDAFEAEFRRRRIGRIALAIKARPDEVDPELFARLKSLGMFRVFLGVEAGTADALRHLGRGQTPADNARALGIVNRLDIHSCFNLLLFHPDSRLEDVAANVAFLRAHPRNPMNFCRTEIYAGTPLERRLRARGRLLGDYWGRDYRIADPRAQLAFDIAFPAFRERNYGDEGLHHTTMRVDYEHQLFAHFFGPDEPLRRRVKSFVVDANLDTCGHLEEILACVASGLADDGAVEAFVEDLAGRIRERDARFAAHARGLLDDLREAADRRLHPRSEWLRRAAAAGLVAALSLGSAACRKSGQADADLRSHPMEEVPTPAQPDEGAAMDAFAELPAPLDAAAADAASGAEAPEPADVGATGDVDRDGSPPPPDAEPGPEAATEAASGQVADAARAEVPPRPPTQPYEDIAHPPPVPPPPVRPPTHMHERVAHPPFGGDEPPVEDPPERK